MEWHELKRVPCNIDINKFLRGVLVWIIKPHIANRRLIGAQLLHYLHLPQSSTFFTAISNIEEESKILEIAEDLGLKSVERCDDSEEVLYNLIQSYHGLVVIRRILPKQQDQILFEAIKIDVEAGRIEFYPSVETHFNPSYPYALQYQTEFIKLLRTQQGDYRVEWFSESVLPKISTWGEQDPSGSLDSLQLIDLQHYGSIYRKIKLENAGYFIKNWPTNMDALKSVYEDIGISSYLLTLWGKRKPFFLDLGCGNGLLTHFLIKEGCKGVGIDVRERGVWELYPEETILKEATIDPRAQDMSLRISELLPELFLTPKYGEERELWIIGNHPDELTPWIPVLAARLRSSFFLLPCCCYDFYNKFQRKNTKLSQYEEYFNFLKKISEACGFVVESDRLKIPSTKRRCLVGRLKGGVVDSGELDRLMNNSLSFVPRAAAEPVRNLTQVDRSIVNKIVEKVFRKLLEGVDVSGGWSAGRKIPLKDLVGLCEKSELVALKQGCGGIKTLLKNHSHVFKVRGDIVEVRTPEPVDIRILKAGSKKALNLRKKPCWFYLNHPQGCPLLPEHCSFLHPGLDVPSVMFDQT